MWCELVVLVGVGLCFSYVYLGVGGVVVGSIVVFVIEVVGFV